MTTKVSKGDTPSEDIDGFRKQIDVAMTCDRGCGHKVDPETCYQHQIDKIQALISTAENKARIAELGAALSMTPEQQQARFNELKGKQLGLTSLAELTELEEAQE